MTPKSFSLWVLTPITWTPPAGFSDHCQRGKGLLLLLTQQPSFSSRVRCPGPQWTPLFHQGPHQSVLDTPFLCVTLALQVQGSGRRSSTSH